MLFQKIHVMDCQRAVLSRNGRFRSILLPGTHRLLAVPRIQVEFHRLSASFFESKWAAILFKSFPAIVDTHFTAIETSDTELAMIYLNGELRRMLLPSSRVLLWKDAGAPLVERINIIDRPERESYESDLDWSIETPQKW